MLDIQETSGQSINIPYSTDLPIFSKRNEILDLIKKNQVIIVAGETGSGKTTHLPLFCMEANLHATGLIGCTQPRRIAATSIAARVAHILRSDLGSLVGYKIRFSQKDSQNTKIKFMTDGILLAELESDRNLRMYSTLIIDEAHERSLNIDFILGYLRNLLPKRPDLKLIISSATIDVDLFSKSFNNAPIIEVSGRMYPVEVFYSKKQSERENDEIDENEGYVDEAVKAVEEITDGYGTGDCLVFMPTERDIRETCDRLRARHREDWIVLPLYAKLSRQEQDLIFYPQEKRKVVVATNIAETSITIPNIRFVVDTGLARTSCYIPRLRTNRLPISPISQASANQRKGRCGRVRDGICVRLYTEEDFLGRDEFTLPEIKRSNLAGVILNMLAHRLGNVESFPFLEPPSKQAISEGYALLRELKALDEKNNLTDTGRQIAKLPLDPHIAAMILAAKKENCLKEIKIIAAGLSVVDPRERPFDKQAQADLMHKKFSDFGSDFITYIKLWDAYHDQWAQLKTQNKMRKFCQEHFLSYTRIREWFDIREQIQEVTRSIQGLTDNSIAAHPNSIHRALLHGLLSNCAQKDENNIYKAARNRKVMIFPGSVLYGKGPQWIMCHEIVETSQVFCRTLGPIDPKWIEEIGVHLCKVSYDEPFFDEESGCVRARKRVDFMGLQVAIHNNVRYGSQDPLQAFDIFVRDGLVEEKLKCYHPFYSHNRKIKQEILDAEDKLRSKELYAGDYAIEEFYKRVLPPISSIQELNQIIKEKGNDNFLFLSKDDVLSAPIPDVVKEFPDKITVGGKNFPLKYAFEPGSSSDGVTLRMPVESIEYFPFKSSGWLLPSLWPSRVEEILRSLPKDTRKKLFPLSETAKNVASQLKVTQDKFEDAVIKKVYELYKIAVPQDENIENKISPHLQIRFEIYDKQGKIVATTRGEKSPDISVNLSEKDETWHQMISSHEKENITTWNFGPLQESITIKAKDSNVPLFVYPALTDESDKISLRMYPTKEQAEQAHRLGVKKLLELSITQEIAWVEKELRLPSNVKLLIKPYNKSPEDISQKLLSMLKEYLLKIPEELPRKDDQFINIVNETKQKSKGLAFKALSILETVLTQTQALQIKIKKETRANLKDIRDQLQIDLDMYTSFFINGNCSFRIFEQYPRYLKAFTYRIDRAFLEPFKYREKYSQLNPYKIILGKIDKTKYIKNTWVFEELFITIEEYAISLFAQQEVKTLFPISPKRIDEKIRILGLKL